MGVLDFWISSVGCLPLLFSSDLVDLVALVDFVDLEDDFLDFLEDFVSFSSFSSASWVSTTAAVPTEVSGPLYEADFSSRSTWAASRSLTLSALLLLRSCSVPRMPTSSASRAASAALTRSSSALRKTSCSAWCAVWRSATASVSEGLAAPGEGTGTAGTAGTAEATSMPSHEQSSAGQLGGTLPQFWMHQASSAAVCPTTAAHEATSESPVGSGDGSGEGARLFLASFFSAASSSLASFARCAADLGADLAWAPPLLLALGATLEALALVVLEPVPASAIGGSSEASTFLEAPFLVTCFLPLASATEEGAFLADSFLSSCSSLSSQPGPSHMSTSSGTSSATSLPSAASVAASRAACALVSSLSLSTLAFSAAAFVASCATCAASAATTSSAWAALDCCSVARVAISSTFRLASAAATRFSSSAARAASASARAASASSGVS
mgnify:CR=1 FL=1